MVCISGGGGVRVGVTRPGEERSEGDFTMTLV